MYIISQSSFLVNMYFSSIRRTFRQKKTLLLKAKESFFLLKIIYILIIFYPHQLRIIQPFFEAVHTFLLPLIQLLQTVFLLFLD